jgi:hypothetical protein
MATVQEPVTFSHVLDPVTVQGCQGGRKSNFRAKFQRVVGTDGKTQILIRIDDDLEPGFWAELTVDPERMPDEYYAVDFRYAK